MDDSRIDEFSRVCEPVINFIRKYGNPHSKIVITNHNAEMLSGEMGIPYPEKDD